MSNYHPVCVCAVRALRMADVEHSVIRAGGGRCPSRRKLCRLPKGNVANGPERVGKRGRRARSPYNELNKWLDTFAFAAAAAAARPQSESV